jgi:crotonobetainyl-CoA:carnitine CoA-transferase CaiB-like acyl-CoA transferase
MPNRLAAWAVYDVFETGDGQQIFIGIVSDTQWRAFCERFGLPDLLSDPALATNPQRVKARDAFMPRLRALFASMPRAALAEAVEAIGLPFAPIMRPEDLFDDPHLQHPGTMVPVTLPDGRASRVPALPLEMDGRRLGLRLDIPRPGQQSAAIAAELGYSPDEIARLAAAGVIRVDPA